MLNIYSLMFWQKILGRKKRSFWFYAKILFFVFLFSLALGAGFFIYLAKDLPSPDKFASIRLAESTKIYDRTGEILLYDIHGEEKRTIVSFSEISPYVKLATIAAEDKDFYKHWGVDFKAIVRATGNNLLVWSGLKQGKRIAIEGGSTITQQVIKNTLLSRERTIQRKIKEWILAAELEMRYQKDEILSFYLNLVPYGSNSYGIEAAANTYFKKNASDLTLAEAAILASLPKAPSYFWPYGSHPDDLILRQQYILKRMLDLGLISNEDYNTALEEKIEFTPNVILIKAPHFVFYVREYLEDKFGAEFMEKGGLRVITALDWQKQELAEKIIKDGANANEKTSRAFNAALVALDPRTGEILAMVGSKDYYLGESQPKNCQSGRNCLFDPNVNVATRPRQPGSSFKPIVYSSAFEKGLGPQTMIFDLETEFNPRCLPDASQEKDEYGLDCYHPQNYDGKFRGPVSLKEALAQSLNIPAVKVLYLAGVKESIDLAHKLGINTLKNPDQYGLALVLGGGEVKLLEETSAFAVFANDGVKNPPIPVLKIIKENGDILEEYAPQPEKVLDENIARQISEILSDNEARAPIFGERSALYFEDRKVAAKTGTTQEYRDAWTIGYTPSIAVGVWVGNNDNSPMRKGPGAMVAAPIWKKFLLEALKDTPPEEFAKPEEKALPQKPMLNGDYLKRYIVKIDKISGKLATDLTPQNLAEEKEFKEIHEILHYIDKNNIFGDEPQNPQNDPQYKNWEESLKKWLNSWGIEKNQFNEKPPQDYDVIHTAQNKPVLEIYSPEDGAVFDSKNRIILKYNVSAALGLKKVEYFFDDTLIQEFYPKQNDKGPFEFSFTPVSPQEKNHLLTVVVYDAMENKTLDQIEIIINN